ncbi:MAG: lamin tail domain-containing protein [Chloroflexi bacterium]|nr:lamin tail domain-containing protein [Chloroflexota bacterium]
MNRNLLPLFTALVVLLVIESAQPLYATPSAAVLISGVYYDPFVTGEASEAIQVQNASASPVSIANWKLSDGEGAVTFPSGAQLNAGQKIWATKSAATFFSEFGFLPDYEYGGNSDASVPDMAGSAPSLTNAGDQVYLKNDADAVVDAMVYGNATLSAPDWNGAAVQLYDFGSASAEGQILYRKVQELDGMPALDTDTRADWAQDTSDNVLGKKVQYPGWDLDEFFQTTKSSAQATVKYCVAPDHLYDCVRSEILGATSTISIEIYSLDNANLVDALTQTIESGVEVSVLLDGSALDDQGKWACQQFEARGAPCWLMSSKPQANIHKRYDNQHGKWIVIDQTRVLIGSENMGDDAMPADDKSNGTLGTRGGYFISDSAEIVVAAQMLLERDFDPTRHADVRRWGTNTNDFPPFGFAPNYVDGGRTYPVQFPNALTLTGALPIELVQCPENCLRTSDALLGMVAQADAGDTLLVEQLYEYTYWGAGSSNSVSDPNLRLEAYIAAAKRGARVRILLDSFYDSFGDARSNWATCAYINARSGLYDIQCRLGNPTGRGIHLKMVLLQHDARGFVHLGSINGSETSNKLNRELATQVESLDAFHYWANVFNYDWSTTTFAPRREFFPFLFRKGKP